jgi:hypothetical protein
MGLSPVVEGGATLRSEARPFLAAFARRIETGLLGSAASRRCNYVVTKRGADELGFRARDWATALNVGLNDVELSVSAAGVRYRIWYWRWAAYAVVLAAVLGLVFILLLLTFDVRAYLLEHSRSMLPGLSLEQHVAMAWGMAIFWGFVWPWILIAAHRRPLRRLMTRIIAEVDDAATSGPEAAGSIPQARP